MKLGNAFTPEEQERLLKAPNILADFFKRAGDVGFTVAAEQIRATYWEIETHATRLRRMAKGWQSAEMGMVQVGKQAEDVLNKAADELDRLTKFSIRRPFSELRQETWRGDNGPYRRVIFWFYLDPQWRCVVGRKTAAGTVVLDAGYDTPKCPLTHFSELPSDETP